VPGGGAVVIAPVHGAEHEMTGAAGSGPGAGGRVVRGPTTGAARGGGAVSLDLAVLVEVPAHGVDVVVEAEGAEGPADVVAVDGLALLLAALVGGLAGDEADELGDALLHGLLGLLGDLGVGGQDLLHDAPDVGDGQQPVLLLDLLGSTCSVVVLRHAAS
jgi:hypothetical protein